MISARLSLTRRIFSAAAASLLALGTLTACSKSGEAETTEQASSVPAGPATQTQILETVGWLLGSEMGVAQLGLNEQQLQAFMRGLRAALEERDPPADLDSIGPLVMQKMDELQTAHNVRVRDANRAEGTAYFSRLSSTPNVVALPSGLRYEVLTPGTGATPRTTDTVRVHYEGRFIDGTVFDSSLDGDPVEFPLNGVIAGWTEGLQHVRAGGKIKLHVPSNLAYGDEGRPGMPPAATLIFEISLLDIVAPAAEQK